MTLRTALACTFLSLLAGCPSSAPEPLGCEEDTQCSEGAICVGGVCAGNSPPIASFHGPVGATTNRLVSLVSSTKDPEGRPVTHRWTVRALTEGCAPDVEPGDGPQLDVVFWCPGTYWAAVVPVDEMGAEGAEVSDVFEVTGATGAPTVTAGPAISATHSCDLGVPECRVVGPGGSSDLQLSAVGTDSGGGVLEYEWVAIPPETAVLGAGHEPSFAPHNLTPAPIASIANDGGPIAGMFRFRVRVQNAEGFIGQAYQNVMVANGAPAAAPPAAVLAHTFVDGRYVAEGDVDTGATDADGDALFAEATLSPAPPDGCEETVAPAANGRVRVQIACETPGALIGATARSLAGTVVDANGASASFTTSVTVTNRPPIFTLVDGSVPGSALTLGHGVQPCTLVAGALCFVAEGPDPFVAVDPDGDTLDPHQLSVSVATTKTSSKGTLSADGASYRFRFETPTTLPTEFRSTAGVTGFSLRGSVSDPFGATGTVSLPLTVTNRAPVIVEAAPNATVPHSYVAADRRYRATVNGALFEDPDGDPLQPTATGIAWCSSVTLQEGRAVTACERAWDYTLGGVPPLSDLLRAGTNTVKASDGWEFVNSPTAVTFLDRPGSISAPITSVESCECGPPSTYFCARYSVRRTGVPVPVELRDDDGDPHLVTPLPVGFASAQLPATCIPGWCYPTINTDSGASGTVAARAGASTTSVTALFQVAPTCSFAGECCQ